MFSVYTEKPLHRGAFTHKGIYTEKLLHTDAVTQRSLYTESFNRQARLQTETFTQRSLCRESLYTRKLSHTKFLHREAFTPRSFREEAFPTCSKKKTQFHDSMNMFKRAEAAGPHSIAFKPTLRWHRGSSNPAEPTMSVSSKKTCTYMYSLRCGTANYLKRELWILTSMTSQISPHCKMCKRCKGGVPQSCQLLTLWPLDTLEFRESNSFRCIQMHNLIAPLWLP